MAGNRAPSVCQSNTESPLSYAYIVENIKISDKMNNNSSTAQYKENSKNQAVLATNMKLQYAIILTFLCQHCITFQKMKDDSDK